MNPRELQLEKDLLRTEKALDELRQRYEPQRITIKRRMPTVDLLVGDVVIDRYWGPLGEVATRRAVVNVRWARNSTLLLVTTVNDLLNDEAARAASELTNTYDGDELLTVERKVNDYHD